MKKEPGDTNVSDALTKPLHEQRMTNPLTAMGGEFRWANLVGVGGAITSRIVSRSMKFRCGFLEREWSRSGVRCLRRTWSGAGWWHADLRHNVDGQIRNPRRQVTPR